MANRLVRPVMFAFEPDVVSIYAKIGFGAAGASILDTKFSKGICNVSGGYAGVSKLNLGLASTMAVLSSQSITNAGTTTITGDSGLSPGSSITGTYNVSGTSHVDDATAVAAQVSLAQAIASAQALTPTTDLTGIALGGLTLTAGVYKFASSAALTGTLTFDAQNDANAVFIIQIGSTLTTAASAVIALTNGAVADNIYFIVGSSATLGSSNTFLGNILAVTSITLGATETVTGRLLANNGSVVLGATVAVTVPTAGTAGPVGLYTITLGSQFTPIKRLDAYNRLLGVAAMWDETGLAAGSRPAAPSVYVQTQSVSVATLASITIQCGIYNGSVFTALSPNSGEILRLAINLTRSSAI